jgi:hypothetical protein
MKDELRPGVAQFTIHYQLPTIHYPLLAKGEEIMNHTITVALTALLLAALTLTPAASVQASVVTLADNTGNTEFNTAFTTNSDWQAQAFTTTATAYTITDVALLLSNSTATTGTFDLSIYDSAGADGSPGAKVAAVRTAIDATTIGLTTALYDVSGLSISLSPNTQYYLAVTATALKESATYGIEWSYTDAITSTGFPSAYSSSPDGGGKWTAPEFITPSMMRIQAETSAVPEPSTYALLCISLGVVGYARRKLNAKDER